MGSSWNPQPMSATTGVGYKPMNQSMSSISPQASMQPLIYPQLQPMMVNLLLTTTNQKPPLFFVFRA